MNVDGMNEPTSRIFAGYLELFNRQKFTWQAVHGLTGVTLTDAQLRECINDVCDRLRYILAVNGAPLSDDEHVFLKDALIKKLFGPTKRMW